MKLHVLHHSDGDYVKKSVYEKVCRERNALLLEVEELKDRLHSQITRNFELENKLYDKLEKKRKK